MDSLRRACTLGGMLVLGAGLTSCASFKKEKTGAELRKEGYEALLKTVKPGMYRRQLYAVLPPCRTPLAEPPSMKPLVHTEDGWSTKTDAHMECHDLDDECFLVVYYQLRNGREYGFPQSAIDPPPPKRDKGSVQITPDIAHVCGFLPMSESVPFRKGQPHSKENPDDIIVSTLGVFSRAVPVPNFGSQYIQFPFQRPGARIGRPLSVGVGEHTGSTETRAYHEPNEYLTPKSGIRLRWGSFKLKLYLKLIEMRTPKPPPPLPMIAHPSEHGRSGP